MSVAGTGLTVQVRLFASLRERAGWDARRIELAAGTTPEGLWRQLGLGDGAIPATVRVAVNQAFADPHQPLAPGDELAFLPPISGG
ncbi:molybdopterin converting factor subunit 1 [Vulcanococcus limneticus]|uniref:molybdopterin converting factor subunit 1 n=1 Tax=Vulcanococcus limneticus TaxID=2170428 RepID=UPI000B98455B|nr:molybdopterin converting factor subunit 1 [Vulcanococcus limneticus]MCP9791319.1 molybdopterin converting factor subunit 1 [Vulcanococcus limneticus MW73D5]MCP9893349.1 molybdopterin converting factor subunit 1 [Vulcanococcus limneticus Candia 3F8]MCP9896634.1 molybdopterin converting factor subunit 1 [Vulcanococcus limneticus Candia 3B3]